MKESIDISQIPGRFRSTMWDRFLSAQEFVAGDQTLLLYLEFNRRLDCERLAKAMDLVMDAEPVLGCRFVHKWWRPFWERLEVSDRRNFTLTEDEAEFEAFQKESVNAYQGPLIQACLLRASESDCFLIKASHIVADAAGTRHIADIIRSIYSHLEKDPDYRPEPNLKGSRGFMQILRHLPWYAYPQAYIEYWRTTLSLAFNPTCHSPPLEDDPGGPTLYLLRFIPADRAARIIEYGRRSGATLNDLMLAAFLRAMAGEGDWDGKKQLKMVIAVDLRRYIPSGRAEAVCNMQSVDYYSLGTDPGDDFPSALERISSMTKRRKNRWIGLDLTLFGLPFLINFPHGFIKIMTPRLMRRSDKISANPSGLTNMAQLDPESVSFGTRPQKAWMFFNRQHPKSSMFMLGLSSYEGTLTINAIVYEKQNAVVERFLDKMLAELPD